MILQILNRIEKQKQLYKETELFIILRSTLRKVDLNFLL